MSVIDVYFDGACGPVNPGGITSYGVVIKIDGAVSETISERFHPPAGMTPTNNVAEYAGLRAALWRLLNRELEKFEITVYGDSNLVINQMCGNWRIKSGAYEPIAIECLGILTKFHSIRFKWIPREQNTVADELSKAGAFK